MSLLRDDNYNSAEAQNEFIDYLLNETSELLKIMEEKAESHANSTFLNLQVELDEQRKWQHAFTEDFDLLQRETVRALNHSDEEKKNGKYERETFVAELKRKKDMKLAQLHTIEEEVNATNQAMLEKQNLFLQLNKKIESEKCLRQERKDLLQTFNSLEYEDQKNIFLAERAKMDVELKLMKAEMEEMRQECSDAADRLATIQSECRLKKVERDEIRSKIDKQKRKYLCEKKKNVKLSRKAQSESERQELEAARLQTEIAKHRKQITTAKIDVSEFISEIKQDMGDFHSLDDLLLVAQKELEKVGEDYRDKAEKCETLKDKKVSNQEKLKTLKELNEQTGRAISDKNQATGGKGLRKRKLPNEAVENEEHEPLASRKPLMPSKIESTFQKTDSSITDAWSTSDGQDEESAQLIFGSHLHLLRGSS